MEVPALLRRCHDAAAMNVDDPTDPQSLIGFFQHFRPDGTGLQGMFEDIPGGDEVHERLDRLYDHAGNDRREDGRRDVYFLVRKPEPISPAQIERLATDWLNGLHRLAQAVENKPVIDQLASLPSIRVLEGKAPKNPKHEIDQSDLFRVFANDVPQLTDEIRPISEIARALKPAFYFISCDAMLRDHLMWPIHAQADPSLPTEPFESYYELWRHGIKYRILRRDTIDFYIPRPPVRVPIQVGAPPC